MLRLPPTQISLSDREVLSLLHTIQLQRAALSLHLTLHESSLARQNETESPFAALSSTRQTRSTTTTSSSSFSPSSSSTEYSQSEYDRLANEVLRCYQEAKLYLNSSDGGNSSDETSTPDPDLLAEYLSQSRPVFSSRAANLDGPVRINETSASSWRNNRVQSPITSNSTPTR